MLGGFLGAGKTTSIARLAAAYQERGESVGIVTNDQAADLVDTELLRSQGFDVGEVAGSCFCCNFNELTAVAGRLGSGHQPDVVLAEPVGSCTDLVATVILPLRNLFQERFNISPYGVILKPSHGRRILKNEANAGFSPKAAYIFRKQLEEADFVVINRIDQLAAEEIDELETLIQNEYPGRPIVRMSARTGLGFEGLVEMLDMEGAFGRRVLEVDYDIYAEGEAELGWLNSSLAFLANDVFELDALLSFLVEQLREELIASRAEAAHLKVIGMSDGAHGVANLISNEMPAELSLAADCSTKKADLIVNARVATDPEQLSGLVQKVLLAAADKFAARIESQQTQSFRPGRPVPTHRMGGET
jgi:Ni2+-binding GTPase involved in maturation of urease and hydrogenase